MTAASELDVDAYRAWRFGPLYRDEVVAAESAREAYRYYYRLRYPLDELSAGRGRRLSALHSRLAGARRGLRRQERMGARRALRARPHVAARR